MLEATRRLFGGWWCCPPVYSLCVTLHLWLLTGYCQVVDDSHIIKLGVILPKEGNFPWSLPQAGPAIAYAVDNVQNRSDLLPGYELKVHMGASQCSDTYGPLVAIDMYLKQMAHVFIGPACDYAVAPVARFSPHWNIPVLTGGALVQAFKDKKNYAQLTRMTGSYAKLGEFFSDFFKEFTWLVPGLIYHSNIGHSSKGRSKCHFVMESIYLTLQRRFRMRYPDKDVWYKAFDENLPPTSYNMTSILKEAALHTRRKTTSHSLIVTLVYIMIICLFVFMNSHTEPRY